MKEPSSFIEINEPMISAHKVLERWQGVGEKELAVFIEMSLDGSGGKSLHAYHVHRVLSDGAGKTFAECLPYVRGDCYKNSLTKCDGYNFTNIVFILEDIEECEKHYPEVLYRPVNSVDDARAGAFSEKEISTNSQKIESQPNTAENNPCDNIDNHEFYKMVCEVLARGICLGDISPEFVVESLQAFQPLDLKIECLMDILEIVESTNKIEPITMRVTKYLEIIHSCDAKCYGISSIVPQGTDFFNGTNKEKYDFIQALLFLLLRYIASAQCASQVSRHLIERCKAAEEQLTALEATNAQQAAMRTTAATKVRQEKTLNAWKPAVDAMIKVAVRCGEEGRMLRQQPDFNAMFNELDAVLNNEQIALFRKALPDEHIDRTGGPKGKGTPS